MDRGRNNSAISDVISTIIVLLIVSSTISAVLFLAVPALDDKKAEVRADNVSAQFEKIDEVLHEVISQGPNASKEFNIVSNSGYMMFDPVGERFVIYYSLLDTFDFNVTYFDDDNDNKFRFEEGGSSSWSYMDIFYLSGEFDSERVDRTGPSANYTVTNPLNDAIQINVRNTTEVIGRIWLFDTGYIKYETSSSSRRHSVIVENGGIIRADPGNLQNAYLFNEPIIFNKTKTADGNNITVINMIQLKPTDYTSMGASIDSKSIFRLFLKMNLSAIHEKNIDIPRCLKIQVFGDYNTSWINYFTWQKLNLGQYDKGTAEGTLYFKGAREFSLIQSIVYIDGGITT